MQLIQQEGEVFVLARSVDRAEKEGAMRRRQLRGLGRDLRSLRRLIRNGQLKDRHKIERRLVV